MWSLLTEIEVSTQWQWTPVTTGEWFRFEFVQLQEVRVDITQGDGSALFEVPIRVTTNNPQVLHFKRPPLGIADHQIAIRTGDRVYRNYQLGWKIRVFVSTDDAQLEPTDSHAQILELLEELMPLARSNQAVTSTTATSEPVASAIASTVLLEANVNRKGATFYSASSARLSINLGATASAADCIIELDLGDYWELPFGYTGVVSGVWSAVSGSVLVSELT
jgi:hypothetical protein